MACGRGRAARRWRGGAGLASVIAMSVAVGLGALLGATSPAVASAGAAPWKCATTAFGACSFRGDPGWDEYNNPWNHPAMPPNSYTLYAASHSTWEVVAKQAKCSSDNCAVEAYASAQYDYDNKAGLETIAEITRMTSSFRQQMPTGNLRKNGFDAEAAYDIWLNNYGLEVMIWVDNQGQTPAGSEIGTVDLGRTSYTVYAGGSTYSFVADRNETSGTVNIRQVLDWLVAHHDAARSSYMTQFNFGWEICSTDGRTDTFRVDALGLRQSFRTLG